MRSEPRRDTTARRALVLALVVLPAGALGMACSGRGADPDGVRVSWEIMTPTLTVGNAAIADVMLRDGQNQPIRGARVEVQAFMSHPGMAPVRANAAERGDGVYRVQLRFTMAGDWTAVVIGSLPDGQAFRDHLDIGNVRPAG